MRQFTVQFSRTELEEIEENITFPLQSNYAGNYEGVDMSECDPHKIADDNMSLMTVLRMQSILYKIKAVKLQFGTKEK